MQTKDHHFCCTCVCLCCVPSSCETFFLQWSSLERASRSLAKTGLFLGLFGVFVSCSFSGRVWGGPGGPRGAIGVDLGAIWVAFWGHFGDFFRIRGIFKNISFTKVKRYFLRFGRVPDRDFFVLCFWIYAFTVLWIKFWGSVGFQGPHGAPNGSLWGPFWCQISAHFVTLVASWFQSGSKAPKRSHFGSLWGVFLGYFAMFFVWHFNAFVQDVVTSVRTFYYRL